MSSSNFLTDLQPVLVADASFIINLNATARASEIIKAIPSPIVITDNAYVELVNGARNGHGDAKQLQGLLSIGLIQRVGLSAVGNSIYEGLVEGSALRTLDDGEAATIGYAHEVGGVAVIDERKARRLCSEDFPHLRVVSTIDLLMLDAVGEALGDDGKIEAIVNALSTARMRIPPEHLRRVVTLIGEERAAACTSLPRAARTLA